MVWVTLGRVMWRQQRKKDFEFISELFGSTMIMGTILKIHTENGIENYTNTVGDPMAEDTLIVGDDENNVILCFKECSNLCHKDIAVKDVHIAQHFNYNEKCIVHKRQELASVPERLINIIFQKNSVVHNVTNNFNRLQINPIINDSRRSKTDEFMHTFYIKGGMIPLKDVKNNPEWKKEYEADMVIKRVHICKSCKGKAYKGCCSCYSPENRSKITMIIGWSVQ